MRTVSMWMIATMFIAALILTSCSNPEGDYKKAEQANTEQAFSDFIKAHPKSPLIAEAQTRLESLAYAAAKRARTTPSFEDFLKRFPTSPLAKNAATDLEAFEYEQANSLGTVSAFETFLHRFPEGEHSLQAKSDLERAEFEQASKQSSITGWTAFLKKYPQSAHAEAAKQGLSASSFEHAAKENTASLFEAFLKEFPDSPRTKDALEKLASLVLKDLAEGGTIDGYESFLKRFGGTSVAASANNELARLLYPTSTKENTIESYEAFLKRFPNSELAEDAKKRLEPQREERDWNRTLLENNLKALADFYDKYPKTKRLKILTGNIHVQSSARIENFAVRDPQVDVTIDEDPSFRFTCSYQEALNRKLINEEDEHPQGSNPGVAALFGIKVIKLGKWSGRGKIYSSLDSEGRMRPTGVEPMGQLQPVGKIGGVLVPPAGETHEQPSSTSQRAQSKPDDVAALQKKAEAGDAEAQERLANLYYEGKQGALQNKVEAYKWAWIAFRRGRTSAKFLLTEFDLFMSKKERADGKALAEIFLTYHK